MPDHGLVPEAILYGRLQDGPEIEVPRFSDLEIKCARLDLMQQMVLRALALASPRPKDATELAHQIYGSSTRPCKEKVVTAVEALRMAGLMNINWRLTETGKEVEARLWTREAGREYGC